jgi:hypothetical protein
MSSEGKRKVVRSYRLVFRRQWRIFRIQGWRIPLPGGLELRQLGYWLVCLGVLLVAARLPLLGAAVSALPSSLRLVALPIAVAWGLSHWEVDGRPSHRALLALLLWRVRHKDCAGFRRCPAVGNDLAPLGDLALGPDLSAPTYPRGRVRGPVKLLLRYPASVAEAPRLRPGGRGRVSSWRLRGLRRGPLHSGRTIEVPSDASVLFEGHER